MKTSIQSDITDEMLVTRLKKGETTAFDVLVERYKNPMYVLAYRLVSNRTDAEDIVQESFVRVYRYIHGFREEARFVSWLTKIVVNLTRTVLRKRYITGWFILSRKQDEEDTTSYDMSGIDTSLVNNPETEVELNERVIQLRSWINELPYKQKETVILKYYQNHTISEISAILTCAEGTVKTHLHRAIKYLTEKYKEIE